jgi:hypothetical protein
MVDEGDKPFTRDSTVQLEFEHVGDAIWELHRKFSAPQPDQDLEKDFNDVFMLIKSVMFKAIETTFDSGKETKKLMNSPWMEE